MKRPSARTMVTIAITLVMLSLFLFSTVLGMFPDIEKTRREGRVTVAELMALGLINDIGNEREDRIGQTLRFAVERNSDIESAAVRDASGLAIGTAGDHAGYWTPIQSGQSSVAQITVPIMRGNTQWGSLELRFREHQRPGVVGMLDRPIVRFALYLLVGGFFATYFILGRMLRALDPTQAVPSRVRSALDTISEGLIAIDTKGQVMLANAAFATLCGRDADALVGISVADLAWVGDEDGQVKHPWERTLQDSQAVINESMTLKDKDGKQRTFLVNCSPVLGGNGKALGALIGLGDVTELEEKEIQLRRSKEEAEAANRSKSEFLANMSHEIRTPMNAILGFTNLLKRGYAKNAQQRQEYLQTIESSGSFLLELINDLLDLSKIEAGSLTMETLECEAHLVVRDVCTTLQLRAQENNVDLSFAVTTEIPQHIQTDPTRLRQIVTNLLGNAIKFTSDGTVDVTVALDADDPTLLAVAVTDSGVGMTEDQTKAIFEPFVQADSSITRRFGGTGLGLSISRRFARALGGDIYVDSTAGVGSTFTARIATGNTEGVPRISPEAASQAVHIEEAVSTSSLHLPNAHVLVADDNKQNRDLLRLVLEEHGLRVTTAVNGEEAVAAVSESMFDIILMDVQMPVMDGYEATRAIRSSGIEVPIIALTALLIGEARDALLEAGFDAFFAKPIDVDGLLELIAEKLGSLPACTLQQTPRDGPTPDTESTAPIASRLPVHDPRYRDIVQEFVDQLDDTIKQLRDAFDVGDHKRLAEVAHYLKGVAGSMGYPDFTAPCRDLEHAVTSRHDANIRASLSVIDALAARVVLSDVSVAVTDSRTASVAAAQ
ncbi:MAG: ATP-binding protein [Gammaproteobacteria bacterium]